MKVRMYKGICPTDGDLCLFAVKGDRVALAPACCSEWLTSYGFGELDGWGSSRVGIAYPNGIDFESMELIWERDEDE